MRAYLLASACAVAVATGVSPAAAQNDPATTVEQLSPTAQQDDAEAGQNEVVVTATRREERIQDVPISVTAFQQEELTQKGIVGFEDRPRDPGRDPQPPDPELQQLHRPRHRHQRL
ncbi:hypothetical protein [Sphingomonas sp. S2-65]|uniref:hypothetical protein n=1 Tax=Sphingomonas sp. S2-65 TaxID=2903960 RepID=UPI001F3B6E37|nr:hypothetical protein [Sphingomonas sp. S2-65]UYY59260.1 hypothetical protein LZ586_03970 [Sphingomonas sp. S2-65]